MRSLMQLVAIILFVLAGLSAFGWLLSENIGNAVGLSAFGLALWCASSFTPPAHGA